MTHAKDQAAARDAEVRASASGPPAPEMAPAPALLRSKAAARFLGISPRTLWSLTNAGRVPHVRLGRAIRYPVRALEAWVEQETRGKPSG